MSFNIEVKGGSSVRLPTAGKYCDRDIVITALGGGGGDYTNPWLSYETVEIEIGENTVTNCKDAKTFMESASGFDTIDSFVLLDNVTVTNQLIFKLTGSGETCYRYRNGIGVNNAVWNNNQYDAALVPGTRYLVRKLTFVNTNAPY